jgi:hypothetical protein
MQLDPGLDNTRAGMSAMRVGSGKQVFGKDSAVAILGAKRLPLL